MGTELPCRALIHTDFLHRNEYSKNIGRIRIDLSKEPLRA